MLSSSLMFANDVPRRFACNRRGRKTGGVVDRMFLCCVVGASRKRGTVLRKERRKPEGVERRNEAEGRRGR